MPEEPTESHETQPEASNSNEISNDADAPEKQEEVNGDKSNRSLLGFIKYRWRGIVSLSFFLAAILYYVTAKGQIYGVVFFPHTGPDGPLTLVITLPDMGDLEDFREDPSPAAEISQKLHLPELPDLTEFDPAAQKHFYDLFALIRQNPKNPEIYGVLGQLYQAQNLEERAESLYRRTIDRMPDDHRWHYLLGTLLAEQGQSDEAARALATASEHDPSYAAVWIRLSQHAIENGKPEEAIAHVDKFIALRPEDPYGYVRRAQLQQGLERWDTMREDLETARRLGPIGPLGHRLLSIVYRQLGSDEEAEVHAKLALDRTLQQANLEDPLVDAVRLLTTTRYPDLQRFEQFLAAGKLAEAAELGQAIMGKYEDDPVVFGRNATQLAACLRGLGQFQEALDWVQRAQKASPDRPETYTTAGWIYLDLNQPEDALKQAQAALEIEENAADAYFVRGNAYMQLAVREGALVHGSHSPKVREPIGRAVEAFDRCVALNPVRLHYLMGAAKAHGMAGQPRKVIELMETALEVEPGFPQALQMKAIAERQLAAATQPATIPE